MKGLGHKMSQDKARFHHGTWGAIWCHVPGHSLFDAGEDSTAQCPMSLKFGAKSSTWRELLRMIQELKLNLAGVQQPKTSGLRKESTYSDLTLFDMIQHDSKMSKRERERERERVNSCTMLRGLFTSAQAQMGNFIAMT